METTMRPDTEQLCFRVPKETATAFRQEAAALDKSSLGQFLATLLAIYAEKMGRAGDWLFIPEPVNGLLDAYQKQMKVPKDAFVGLLLAKALGPDMPPYFKDALRESMMVGASAGDGSVADAVDRASRGADEISFDVEEVTQEARTLAGDGAEPPHPPSTAAGE